MKICGWSLSREAVDPSVVLTVVPAQGPRRSYLRNRRAGLSMVEVMIAIVILLVASTAAFSSQLTSMRLIKQSRDASVALSDLQACMESVRMAPVDDLPLPTSPYAHNQVIGAYSDLHLREQRIVANYPGYVVGGPIPDPLTIVLTANWVDERGGQRRMNLRTVRAR